MTMNKNPTFTPSKAAIIMDRENFHPYINNKPFIEPPQSNNFPIPAFIIKF